MRLAIVLIAGALAACATPATPDTALAANSEKICKRMTSTESNVPQRVCRTAEEWDAFERQGLADVKSFERARAVSDPTGQ